MIRSLCMELQFPQEAVALFAHLDAKVMANTVWAHMLQEAQADYMEAGQAHISLLEKLALELGVEPATANMILLLRLALELRPVYAQNGYSDQLYLDSMFDLRYKLLETKQVNQVWGTTVLKWFRPFFHCSRFALGRLQYEIRPWSGPSYEPWLVTGQDAFFCHIPSSGPCRPEEVLDSLKRAYQFYHIQGIFAVGCYSWMLYPPHLPLFPKNGNLMKFQKNFIVFNQEERDNLDLWRIFGVSKDTDFTLLPEDTVLRRNFAPWLRQGNQMGCAHGVILFDGEKILSTQD